MFCIFPRRRFDDHGDVRLKWAVMSRKNLVPFPQQNFKNSKKFEPLQ